MGDSTVTIGKLEDAFKPFIKPREQVNYIRRILALRLGSEARAVPIKHPLSLTATPQAIKLSDGARGIHEEYLEALKAHVNAKLGFDATLQANSATQLPSSRPPTGSNLLSEQIDLLKLRQKHERLLKVQEHLDSILQKAPSAHDYLAENEVFQGSVRPPKVPDIVVNSLAAEQTESPSGLKSKMQQLEKTALRAKLLLRQQESLLKEAKLRAKRQASAVSNAERLDALHATRNELIHWMETELSNASSEEAQMDPDSTRKAYDTKGDAAVIESNLVRIQEKYQRYLQARRSILGLVAHRVQPKMRYAVQENGTDISAKPGELQIDYLLAPYIANLLYATRVLKTDIGIKSHMSTLLKQQSKDIQQGLQHLAQESQLLPAHPSQRTRKGQEHTKGDFMTGQAAHQDLTSQIQPWVSAADKAKIVTLVSVTETVEAGQMALEDFMRSLEAIRQLSGQEPLETSKKSGATGLSAEEDDDLWLGQEDEASVVTKKRLDKQKVEAINDPWSKLRGNLGLISHDELS
ncbi:hypothetical protein HJFPF1_01550 [Paramyrothecium foliicola]|nr:hypothetical protein HJFPF1_01550 [Paramyrothecium foliicola]